jgi:hypothetical protein
MPLTRLIAGSLTGQKVYAGTSWAVTVEFPPIKLAGVSCALTHLETGHGVGSVSSAHISAYRVRLASGADKTYVGPYGPLQQAANLSAITFRLFSADSIATGTYTIYGFE